MFSFCTLLRQLVKEASRKLLGPRAPPVESRQRAPLAVLHGSKLKADDASETVKAAWNRLHPTAPGSTRRQPFCQYLRLWVETA